MAQTGDVAYGKHGSNVAMAGSGASELPDIAAEFSDQSFERGVLGMARSSDPNSANSQFFIMFDAAPHLDGQYTVFGRVISGMEVVDAIKKGAGSSGAVENPDYMESVTIAE
jgi:peptidylprolyl isomerase